MPQKIRYMERDRGTGTRAGDGIRARHQERMQAREKGPDELARVLQKQTEERRKHALERIADVHDDEDEEKRGRARDNDYGLE
jgi:hypothetical protein